MSYEPYCIQPGVWNIVDAQTGEIIDCGPFTVLDEVERAATRRYQYDTLQLAIARRGLSQPNAKAPLAYRILITLTEEEIHETFQTYSKCVSKDPNTLHHAAVSATIERSNARANH